MSHPPALTPAPSPDSIPGATPPSALPAASTLPAPPVIWPSAERHAAFTRWIRPLAVQHGMQLASLALASADASFRRYLRLTDATGQQSWIVMDAPPEHENCEPFVRVAGLMAAANVPVPHILAWDEADGFMLLNDLGVHTMMAVIRQHLPPLPGGDAASPHAVFAPRPTPDAATQALYRDALDVLIRWQLASQPGVLPAYDEALLRRELSLFPDWYLLRHRDVDLAAPAWPRHTQSVAQVLDDAFGRIVAHNLHAPSVYVHRDFMPRNLMVTGGAAGPDRLAVLDFQDAVYGPVTYDIASLMRDAFLTWDEEFVLDITVRYWEKARRVGLLDFDGWHRDFDAFYRALEWMGLQRHLKVAGIFARLTLRDGKPHYLADAPRFIAYIRHTCARYRELAPLLRLVDTVEGIQADGGWVMGRG